MGSEIAMVAFFVLMFVTTAMQLLMYAKRAKFLRLLRDQKGIENSNQSRLRNFQTIIEVICPTKLDKAPVQFDEARKSAIRFSNFWVISLLSALIIPILLYNLLE